MKMFLRLLYNDRILFIISLVCLLCILLCYVDINCTIQWRDFFIAAVKSIAGGFISGYIFYIFSVLWDKSKKRPPIMRFICQQVQYAKDELLEMSYNIGGRYDIDQCCFGELKKEIGAYEIPPKNIFYILQAMRNIEMLIQYPISKVDILDKNDIDGISAIALLVSKNITLFSDIPKDKPAYLSEKHLKNIKIIHNILEQTYNSIKKECDYGI